jgi:hypothetical protein
MRKARFAEKDKVIDIISSTFETNPGVNWIINKRGNHKKKIHRLASYAFLKSFLREGAFISSNENGIALCYRFNYQVFSIREVIFQLRFALLSINPWRILKVLKRESYRKSKRPDSGNYLYFWFLGVLPGGEGAVFELRDGIFELATQENLPIYLETAMERTKLAYEWYGFETFHYWEVPAENIKFWFMKWEPLKQS